MRIHTSAMTWPAACLRLWTPRRWLMGSCLRCVGPGPQVVDLLRQWLVRRGRVALENMRTDDRAVAPLITDLADVLRTEPDGLDEAVELLQEATEGRSFSLGPNHLCAHVPRCCNEPPSRTQLFPHSASAFADDTCSRRRCCSISPQCPAAALLRLPLPTRAATLAATLELGTALVAQGRFALGAIYIKAAHEGYLQQLGPGADPTVRAKQALSRAALATGDRPGAVVHLREALAASREHRGYTTPKTMSIQFELCKLLAQEQSKPVRQFRAPGSDERGRARKGRMLFSRPAPAAATLADRP